MFNFADIVAGLIPIPFASCSLVIPLRAISAFKFMYKPFHLHGSLNRVNFTIKYTISSE
nr:MAG TPA: hypothetical protein [Caudoviricetes sp.]